MTHLWTIDVGSMPAGNKAPEATRITEGAFTVQGFSWSPDGGRIAFAASKDSELRDSGSTTVYLVSVADKKVTKLVTTPGPNSNPQFSPDGTQVAFVTADGVKNFFYANQKIAVVPAPGGTPKVVSGDFDEDTRLIQWSDGGIYFASSKKTAAHLYRLDLASGAVTQVTHPDDVVAQGFSFSKDFSQVAYRGAVPNGRGEIYVAPTSGSSVAIPVTHLSDKMKQYTLARRLR